MRRSIQYFRKMCRSKDIVHNIDYSWRCGKNLPDEDSQEELRAKSYIQ